MPASGTATGQAENASALVTVAIITTITTIVVTTTIDNAVVAVVFVDMRLL